MKRHPRMNVNGKVAPNSVTYNEMYPKDTPQREEVEKRMEATTGLDFLTVCRRFDAEMATMKAAEMQAKREKQAKKFENAPKPQ